MTRSEAERDIRRQIRIDEERVLAQRSSEAQNEAQQSPAALSDAERAVKADIAVRVGFEKGQRPAKQPFFMTLKRELVLVRSLYDQKFGKGSSQQLTAAKRRPGFGATLKEQLTILWRDISARAHAARAVNAKPAAKSIPSTINPAAAQRAPKSPAANSKIMSRADFEKLTPRKRLDFIHAGGRLTDSARCYRGSVAHRREAGFRRRLEILQDLDANKSRGECLDGR